MSPRKVAIVIDTWKLDIFSRHLTQSGYEFEQFPGITADCLTLKVNTLSLPALGAVVQAANREAALTGKPV
jgi:hypothetical protein